MVGRWSVVVRRICIVFGLLIVVFSIGIRIRTYLLTRKIHAVLAGLERVQIDKTGEAELLKTVPYLVSVPPRTGRTRAYCVEIMSATDRNYYGWTQWVPGFFTEERISIPAKLFRTRRRLKRQFEPWSPRPDEVKTMSPVSWGDVFSGAPLALVLQFSPQSAFHLNRLHFGRPYLDVFCYNGVSVSVPTLVW